MQFLIGACGKEKHGQIRDPMSIVLFLGFSESQVLSHYGKIAVARPIGPSFPNSSLASKATSVSGIFLPEKDPELTYGRKRAGRTFKLSASPPRLGESYSEEHAWAGTLPSTIKVIFCHSASVTPFRNPLLN